MSRRAHERVESGSLRSSSRAVGITTRRFRSVRAANDNHLPLRHKLKVWPLLALAVLAAGSLAYMAITLSG